MEWIDRSKLDWVDDPQQIFLIAEESVWLEGPVEEAHATREGAAAAIELNPKFTKRNGNFQIEEVTLHRPSLRAVYGGPTLLEALWAELDAIMTRLMTDQQSEDGGDKFRAEELAWVIAIVTNAYEPDMNAVRKEAMNRWKRHLAEDGDF